MHGTPASYARLIGRERIQLAVADPPYNVPIQGHVTGKGRVRHAEFAMGGRRDERAGLHRLSPAW